MEYGTCVGKGVSWFDNVITASIPYDLAIFAYR